MLNKTVDVKLNEFDGVYLNQSSQQVPIRFSYLTKNNETCHPLVMCKDYLHDVLYSIVGKRNINIYGFSYGEKYPMINLDKISLLVVFPKNYTKEKVKEHCETSLRLLHNYENIGQFLGRSTMASAKIANNNLDSFAVVFQGPVEWLSVPAFISLYTMLIRLGAKNFKFQTNVELKKIINTFISNSVADNDRAYLEKVYPFLDAVLKFRKKIFKTEASGLFHEYNKYLEINTIHNSRGILSLCCGGYGSSVSLAAIEKFKNSLKEQ